MTQKFIPILFSTEMVNAILEGRKTQTRRTKGLEKLTNHYFQSLVLHATGRYTFVENGNYGPTKEDVIEVKCPYKIGNILWVRESFHYIHDGHSNKFIEYGYKANGNYKGSIWKPSIHMPKAACRIFLKVTSVRVERLHDISESDAIAEGILVKGNFEDTNLPAYKNYLNNEVTFVSQSSFLTLWQKINGEESWYKNPFVWVIEFEKIDKPQNFI